MCVLKNKIYNTWHRNYHIRIENEYDKRMAKSYHLNYIIKKLEEKKSNGKINQLICKIKLTLAEKRLSIHNKLNLTLLEFHCFEIDIMDGLVKTTN